MKFVDALQNNAANLAQKVDELRMRIDVLKKSGHSADATTNELIKTCDEIGRLNDAIKRELDKPQ